MKAPLVTNGDLIRLTANVSEYAVPFGQLAITETEVAELLGWGAPSEDATGGLIGQTLAQAPSFFQAKAGYCLFDESQVQIEDTKIRLGHARFRTGKLIPRRLQKASAMAAYVATPGPKAEKWAEEASSRKEFLKAQIIYALTALVGERTADWLERRMIETYRRSGLGLTNRFDLGFCGWEQGDAPVLLTLFPKDFCGIRVTADWRVCPRDSLVGIIGIGLNAVRTELPCFRCMDDIACVRRLS